MMSNGTIQLSRFGKIVANGNAFIPRQKGSKPMYLQDNRADVKLIHSRSTAFEVWWLWENEVFVVSHCPENYPSTVVHTMKIE